MSDEYSYRVAHGGVDSIGCRCTYYTHAIDESFAKALCEALRNSGKTAWVQRRLVTQWESLDE